MRPLSLAVVTASVDPAATEKAWRTWRLRARGDHYLGVAILNGAAEDAKMPGFDVCVRRTEIAGVVPAFSVGIREALSFGADIIACFHDDLEIQEVGWDLKILEHFEQHPRAGLACFSGAEGLGASDIYQTPYNPMQLARQGFFSNMRDAEAHGRRELFARKSACGDGFSQIGRAGLMDGWFSLLGGLGILHHAYDSALGALCYRDRWECWYLPVACHHYGGMTAVGSRAYHEWAASRGGDAEFWKKAHMAVYEELRGFLPLRVEA